MGAETEPSKEQGQAVIAFRSPSRRAGWTALPTVVILDDTLSDAAVRLYAMLISYAHQSEGFYIYQSKIAEDLKRSVRAVQRGLTELAERGILTIERQGITKPNIYWLEDAYGLYDEAAQTLPRTTGRVRPRSGDKNGVSATTKMTPLEATKMSHSYKTLKQEEFETSKTTLNVAQPNRKSLLREAQSVHLANRAVVLTGDEKSRKRYEQLAGICEQAGAWSQWDKAYLATEARLRKSSDPLNAPGAYFCGLLAQLLCDAGVYVPVGTKAERDDIKAQIKASLAQADASNLVSITSTTKAK